MRYYLVEETVFYPRQWHRAPRGYRARSHVLRCPKGCVCHRDPRIQLAAARAIIAADRDRAARSRKNYERRQTARQEAW